MKKIVDIVKLIFTIPVLIEKFNSKLNTFYDIEKNRNDKLENLNVSKYKKIDFSIVYDYKDDYFLKKFINSILRQDLDNFEVIIVGTDISSKQIEKLQKINAKIIKNSGEIINKFNAAIRVAKNDWIIFMEYNEIISSNFIKESTLAITENDFLAYTSKNYVVDSKRVQINAPSFMKSTIYKTAIINYNDILFKENQNNIKSKIKFHIEYSNWIGENRIGYVSKIWFHVIGNNEAKEITKCIPSDEQEKKILSSYYQLYNINAENKSIMEKEINKKSSKKIFKLGEE